MDLYNKCIKVIVSCQTIEQFKCAVKFCNLAAYSEEIQGDSHRIINFIIPIERAFAIKEYILKDKAP